MNNDYLKFLSSYFTEEEGAVTVDWVVLTASVVGLGIAVLLTVSSGATTYASTLNTEIETIDVMDH